MVVAAIESDYLLPVYERHPLVLDYGEGCHVYDTDGHRYLDFITGIGVNALGYAHPRVSRVIAEQAGRCLHTSNLFYHAFQGPLAARLAEWSGLSRTFFSNSGTEAMEAALKAAKAYGRGRHGMVALENSFHGRSIGSLSITGQEKYRHAFQPLLSGVKFIEANDIEALRDVVNSETTAIVTEVIQGEGGIYPLSEEFLREVRLVADRHDALWIADETQCGLGRTGWRFAYQRFANLLPDIVVTAKPLAGGLPLGATIFSERAAQAIGKGMHGTTFGGGPLACRVALEVLEVIDGLLPRVVRAGAYLHDRLRELQRRHDVIEEIRGVGMMAGIQLRVAGGPYVEKAARRGLLINCTHETVLRLLPPLIAREAEVDEAMATLEVVLSA